MWDLFRAFVRLFQDFQVLWLCFAALFAFYMLVLNVRRRLGGTAGDPELGDLLWVDEGRDVKPFYHQVFHVLGKPDAIYSKAGNGTAVEYKSRRGPVFDSDRVQAITAALAARGEGFKISKVQIRTKTDEDTISLPKKDLELYQMVEPHVETVRAIRRGAAGTANPSEQKCRGCAYRSGCAHRAV